MPNAVLMARAENPKSCDSQGALSRRTMLKAGGIAAGGIWAAPSILSFDSAAAATGSCLVPSKQVDFTRFAGAILPSSFLSDDGSVSLTFAISDPWNRQDVYRGHVDNATLNGLDNPVLTSMRNATKGDYIDLVFTFDQPVSPRFSIIDIDRSPGQWEDIVRVIGSNGAGTINPASMNLGGAQVALSANTVRGTANTSSSTGNVEFVFDEPITRLEIRHQDNKNWSAPQWIGVHDFYWC